MYVVHDRYEYLVHAAVQRYHVSCRIPGTAAVYLVVVWGVQR